MSPIKSPDLELILVMFVIPVIVNVSNGFTKKAPLS